MPLFALANAGIAIDGELPRRAYTSPITLGHPARLRASASRSASSAHAWLVTRLSRGRLRPPVGWAAVLGGGTIAGIGFTVSLLIADPRLRRRRSWRRPSSASWPRRVLPRRLTWLVFRVTGAAADAAARSARCSARAEPLIDLSRAGRPRARPHPRARGRAGHPGRVRRLRVPVLRPGRAGRPRAAGRLRRRPLRLAAPAADRRAPARPAGRRGRGGRRPAGRVLGDARPAADHQDALDRADLIGYAGELGLDVDRFTDDLRRHAAAARIAEDVDSRRPERRLRHAHVLRQRPRHYGAYDITALLAAVQEARARLARRSGPDARQV